MTVDVHATRHHNEAGGVDNVTVVVVQYMSRVPLERQPEVPLAQSESEAYASAETLQ